MLPFREQHASYFTRKDSAPTAENIFYKKYFHVYTLKTRNYCGICNTVKEFTKNGRNKWRRRWKCIGEEKPLLEACFGASINGTLQTVVGTTNFQVEE